MKAYVEKLLEVRAAFVVILLAIQLYALQILKSAGNDEAKKYVEEIESA